MSDMTSVIAPKSDQINADDLIAGPMTITVTEVQIRGGQEQPVSIYFEGSNKAFRPCKSMSRVLVQAWGPDAKLYAGRSITLYRDPSVKWGGMEVGGIRISHLTDIAAPITMALTATKGKRAPYVVRPLAAKPRPVDALERAAKQGLTELESVWNALSKEDKRALSKDLPRLKEMAASKPNPKPPQTSASQQPPNQQQNNGMSDDDGDIFPAPTDTAGGGEKVEGDHNHRNAGDVAE